MPDLTDRALDTASVQGATYADVRVVRRLEESIAVKSGRVEGVASGESEGFGVRVLVDGAWGFAASHVLTAAEADRVAAQAVRIARASATALRDRTRLDDRPPARGTFETPLAGRPVHGPARDEDRGPAGRRRSRRPGQGHRLHRVELRRPARVEDLRRDRRQPDRAGHHPRRRGGRGERHRRRRAPAPELSRFGRRLAGGRLRVHPGSRPGRPRRAAGRRGGRAADARRSARPAGYTIVLDPSQLYLQVHESCGHPTRARPRLRHRGVVRRHELPDDRQARRGLPLRLGPHRHRRRRDGARAGWARSAGTTRASPRRPCRWSRTGSSSAT